MAFAPSDNKRTFNIDGPRTGVVMDELYCDLLTGLASSIGWLKWCCLLSIHVLNVERTIWGLIRTRLVCHTTLPNTQLKLVPRLSIFDIASIEAVRLFITPVHNCLCCCCCCYWCHWWMALMAALLKWLVSKSAHNEWTRRISFSAAIHWNSQMLHVLDGKSQCDLSSSEFHTC